MWLWLKTKAIFPFFQTNSVSAWPVLDEKKRTREPWQGRFSRLSVEAKLISPAREDERVVVSRDALLVGLGCNRLVSNKEPG